MKELIDQYGAWIVFAVVFLESVGLPLPGETVLVSAAIYAGTAHNLSITVRHYRCRAWGRRGKCRWVLDRRVFRISAVGPLRFLHWGDGNTN